MTQRLANLPIDGAGTDEQSEILIGEALGECVADALPKESLGVLVESPPRFTPETMFAHLNEVSSYAIGMAVVGIEEADSERLADAAQETSIRVTDELSTAIKWRNEVETEFTWENQIVPDRIVVLVRGDPPKLGSLHRLTGLPLGQVRLAICDLMAERDEFAGNTPAEELWMALGGGIETNLTIRSIARYAVSCLKETDQQSIDSLGSELHELGLFTDSALLSDSSSIKDRLIRNGELVDRTIHITNRDRKRLINSIRDTNAADEQSDQAAFIERLRRFQRTNDDSLLEHLQFERVADAFDTTSKRLTDSSGSGDGEDSSTGDSSGGRHNRRTDGESVGVELMHEGDKDEAESLAQKLDTEIDEAIESDENRIELDFGDDEKLIVDVDSDLTHFFQRFVTEERFGGVIRGGDSREECITNYTALDIDYFHVGEDGGSFQKMRQFAERQEEFESLVERFDEYLAARKKLLDIIPSLIHRPLTRLLGDSDLLAQAQAYLEAYQQAQNTLDKKYMSLRDASAQGARRLLSDFLLLDTVILERETGRELVLSPLHPLHLWKYVELANAVQDGDDLADADWEFLEATVDEQPHVLSNITVGGGRLLNKETYLIQSDEIATLPVYTEADRAEPGDNKYLWGYLIEKFNQAYPPSQDHLKISIIDPIKPSQALKAAVDAAEAGHLNGATVEFIYVDRNEKRLLGGATSSEEEAIINLFGPEGDSDAFNILTREYRSYDEVAEHLAENPKHAVIINDQSSFFVEEFERDMDTSINPLYVPKEFDYDAFEDEINISASSEGQLFSEYQNLINQLNNQRTKFHNAGVHQLSITQEQVSRLQESAIWVCVSTPSMNSDPFWETDLISRERRGDREYAIYSQDIDLFTRTLRRILNEYPIAPDSADIESIASRIADTERSGLLRLITEETIGSQDSRNSKGLLGSIIAVQWLDERYADPNLVFSIDDPRTRNWLNFGDSNRRADFIVVQQANNGGLEMDIVEVKTLNEPDSAFTIESKEGDEIARGDAVDQITATTITIRSLFEGEDNITTPPRREALREQLYYELIGRDVPGEKMDWVDRVNEVFRGDAQMTVNPRIVSVEITSPDGAETTTDCVTEDRHNLRITRLPKQTVVRLLMSGKDDLGETDGPDSNADIDEEEGEADEDSDADTLLGETSSNNELDGEDEPDEGLATGDDETEEENETPSSFGDPKEYADQVETLKRILYDYNIDVDSIEAANVEVGPNLIRYKVELASGQGQGPLESRAEDIAREMALEREPFIHRLPGTPFVAVDVPREETAIVHIKDYLDDLPARSELTLGQMPFVAGITPAGESHTAMLNDAPHMLVGGTTGSGKTVFLYSLLSCLLERFSLDDLRLAIVDPKMTNFMFCNQLSNLEHDSVITEDQAAAELFKWIVDEEIPRRMEILSQSGSIDINDHNERSDDHLRPLVVFIDEYADLIDGLGDESDDFEENVRRIAQKARSLGIHLVISTQRPSAKIIDTDLRANLDMRVAFRLPSASDSQVILDESGAEDLGGQGDMLFREADGMTRLQGAFVDPEYLRDLIQKKV